MVKREIIWSHRAKIKLYEVLEYFADRNKSRTYSGHLYKQINKELEILKRYPKLGLKTDIESIRCLIFGDYMIFYEDKTDRIIIHSIWDCRQNPDELKIK